MEIQVLPYKAITTYLGRTLGFERSTRDEIDYRIEAAWAKVYSFMKLRAKGIL